MDLGLGGRQLAAADELGDERVVVGQLLELAAAQQVGARVADVAERDACRRARRARRSSSCPCPRLPRRSSRARARGGSPRWTSSATRASPPALDAGVSRSAAAASPEATSPAWAPPIPSAIAKSGGAQTKASSFRAALPPGVGLACRLAESQAGHASNLRSVSPIADDVAGRRAALARQQDPVHERAVRRADVLDLDAVAARLECARGASTSTRRRRAAMSFAAPRPTRQRLRRRARTCRPRRARGSAARRSGRSRAPAAAPPARGGRLLRAEDHRLLRQPQMSRAAERTMRQMKR